MPKGAVEGLRAMREAEYERNQKLMREADKRDAASRPKQTAEKPSKKKAAKSSRKRG